MCCMLPLLSLIVPALQPKCYSTTSIDSFNATLQDILRNGSVRLKYEHNANKVSASKIHKILPTNTISSAPMNLFENIFQTYRPKVHHTIPYLTSNSSSSTQQPPLNKNSVYLKYSKDTSHQIVPK